MCIVCTQLVAVHFDNCNLNFSVENQASNSQLIISFTGKKTINIFDFLRKYNVDVGFYVDFWNGSDEMCRAAPVLM